jgi:hypothetical protein
VTQIWTRGIGLCGGLATATATAGKDLCGYLGVRK